MNVLSVRATLIAAALMLAGCDAPPAAPVEPPLAGTPIGGPFALIDQDGKPVTDRDFAGKWRIMYFGYTYCPDVCPVDVQTIAAGLKLFEKADPARAATVVPIFVSVDPERDTPAVVKQFVGAFHPRMIGLTGSVAAVTAAARAYRVPFSRDQPKGASGYLVNHSRQAYLMDGDGKPVALLPQDETPQAVAAELARWVR